MVTIITPTFNHEKYISQCIESVLHQTFQNWEMIIIDDGSTDKTGAICREYAQKDPRVRYFFQANKGLYRLAESYNKALSYAKGELIAVLEGDDYWLPNKLEKQVSVFNEREVVFAWSMAETRDDHHRLLETFPKNLNSNILSVYNNSKPCEIINMMFDDFPIPLTWLIKKSTLIEMGGFVQSPGTPMLDRDTIYQISRKGEFGFIPEVLGIYRKQMGQATNVKMIEITETVYDVTLQFYKTLSKEEKMNIHFGENDIIERKKAALLVANSRYGRMLLIKKDFANARKHYLKAMFSDAKGSFVWRFRSFIGWFFSLFGANVEGISKLLGKKYYLNESK